MKRKHFSGYTRWEHLQEKTNVYDSRIQQQKIATTIGRFKKKKLGKTPYYLHTPYYNWSSLKLFISTIYHHLLFNFFEKSFLPFKMFMKHSLLCYDIYTKWIKKIGQFFDEKVWKNKSIFDNDIQNKTYFLIHFITMSFSNFSCMFLNPNIFFHFWFF